MNDSPNTTGTFRTRVRSHTSIAKAAAAQKWPMIPPPNEFSTSERGWQSRHPFLLKICHNLQGFGILHAAPRTQRPLQPYLGRTCLLLSKWRTLRDAAPRIADGGIAVRNQ